MGIFLLREWIMQNFPQFENEQPAPARVEAPMIPAAAPPFEDGIDQEPVLPLEDEQNQHTENEAPGLLEMPEHEYNGDPVGIEQEEEELNGANIHEIMDVAAENFGRWVLRQRNQDAAQPAPELAEDAGDELDGFMDGVGLRGPITNLFQNAFLIMLLVSAGLMTLIWIPYVIGRTLLIVVLLITLTTDAT